MAEFDSVIPPGGAGKVTASVKTDNLKGPVTKSVTVTSNDPAHATISLQLKADVKVVVDVSPSESVFLQGRVGEVKPTVLTLTANDGQVFDILEIKKTAGNPSNGTPIVLVTVAQEPPTVPPAAGGPPAKAQPKARTTSATKAKADAAAKVAAPKPPAAPPVATGSSRYTVSVAPAPEWQAGNNSATVILTTTHPKQPTITLYVNARLTGEVTVTPERVSLIAKPGAQGDASGLVQHVKIAKPSGTALAVEKVDSTDPDIATKLTTVSEGREYDVEVRYTGKPGRGMISGTVTIHTNEAKQKTIMIPVFGRT